MPPSEFGAGVLVGAVTEVEGHGAQLQRGGGALPWLLPAAGAREPAGGRPLSAESRLNVPRLYQAAWDTGRHPLAHRRSG